MIPQMQITRVKAPLSTTCTPIDIVVKEPIVTRWTGRIDHWVGFGVAERVIGEERLIVGTVRRSRVVDRIFARKLTHIPERIVDAVFIRQIGTH